MQSIHRSPKTKTAARHGTGRVGLTLLLLVAMAMFALLISGCGAFTGTTSDTAGTTSDTAGTTSDTAGTTSDTSGMETDTYTDADFGFSFEYPIAWEIDDALLDDEYILKSVGAFDPFGAGVGDYGFDQVVVEVYELIAGDDYTLDELELEFQEWLDDTPVESFLILEPISATTVGGLSGFKATYTYTEQGIDMRSTEYWLIGEGLLYNLYTDSSDDHWDENQGIMEKFITTFTP